MDPGFKPPQDDAEFERRAKEITPKAARIIVRSLKGRLANMSKPLEDEIAFYERVIKHHEGSSQ